MILGHAEFLSTGLAVSAALEISHGKQTVETVEMFGDQTDHRAKATVRMRERMRGSGHRENERRELDLAFQLSCVHCTRGTVN